MSFRAFSKLGGRRNRCQTHTFQLDHLLWIACFPTECLSLTNFQIPSEYFNSGIQVSGSSRIKSSISSLVGDVIFLDYKQKVEFFPFCCNSFSLKQITSYGSNRQLHKHKGFGLEVTLTENLFKIFSFCSAACRLFKKGSHFGSRCSWADLKPNATVQEAAL